MKAAPPPITLAQFLPIFTAVFLPMLLAAVDQTLLATATPSIAADLGGLRDTSWIAVAYLLAAASSAPLFGWLGDRFGLARILQVGVMFFALGSLAGGLTQSFWQLIASRAIQGLGAGGMMTLSQALIGELVPPKERARFQGYFATIFILSAIGGPVLGGIVVSHLSWRWLFLGNIPLAIFAIWRLAKHTHNRANRNQAGNIDWIGLFLLPGCIAFALLWFSSVGHRFSWHSWQSLVLALGAIAGITFLLRHEKQTENPFLSLQLLAEPAIRAALLSTSLFAACMFAMIFYLPIYMQLYLKSSALDSGILILPLSGGAVVGSIVCGRALSKDVLPKRIPVSGFLLSAIALGLLAALGAHIHLIVFLGALTGIGLGTVMPTMQLVSQTVAGRERLGAVTALMSLSRSIGAAIGTTVFGSLIFALLPALSPGATLADFLKLPAADIAYAFHFVFALIALTAASGALIAHRAPPVRL